jgi:acetoacetyl-CoA synthetase
MAGAGEDEGGREVLWRPSPDRMARSNLRAFWSRAQRATGRRFADYDELWSWSVTDPEGFWRLVWEAGDLPLRRGFDRVLGRRTMPGAEWFPGARLNYVDAVFARARPGEVALLSRSECRAPEAVTWDELERRTGAVAAYLRQLGVVPGDRVAAYLPNGVEAVVALLATAAVGAVWTACSPDFGEAGVVDRFGQARPKVLFACDGYRYGGRTFDRLESVRRIRARLPDLERTVLVPHLSPTAELEAADRWPELVASAAPLDAVAVAADHPLWILYSSGTTGRPKGIVQGHAGIVAEHWKATALHLDLGPGDRFLWLTTTGWMMWNFLVGALTTGATIVAYDGAADHPDADALWRLADDLGITHLGVGAAYLMDLARRDARPRERHGLDRLRLLGSTGSPLAADAFRWVYRAVKEDVWLASISGGTDVCSLIVGSNPLLPVRAGEIQCRCLGVAAAAYDDVGRAVVDEVGELVVEAPMPSMPLRFVDDPDGDRLRDAYFAVYPGRWRHGDWVRFRRDGASVIYGRSDATINRRGVRIGTAELYRSAGRVPGVRDALAVDLEGLGGRPFLALFVALDPGLALDDALGRAIAAAIREDLTPRHVPDAIYEVPDIPYTWNGKKLEVPVKRLLAGVPAGEAVSLDAVANPAAIEAFVALREAVGAAAGDD